MALDGDTTEDVALLRAAADDPTAFARFYRRHVHGVIAFFHRRTGDAETAADLTAETFAAALAGCHRFAPDRGAPAAWLYGIAHRQLATLHRRGSVERRARRRLGMARIELTDAMLERVEAIADAERVDVDVAMRALPAGQRAAVRARVLDERSYEEIAAAQAISPLAARQRVSRGLAALRAHLRNAQ